MKYCPACDERYDEEVIRFCTKDGTPLLEEEEPKFAELPSESLPVVDASDEDDAGEVTVIRRRDEIPLPPPSIDELNAALPPNEPRSQAIPQSERIVISTAGPEPTPQQVRPRPVQPYYPPQPQQNTVKVVVLSVLGTLLVLAVGAGLLWLLQSGRSTANVNANSVFANQNANLNSNVGFDSNFNFNAVPPINTNFNTDFNANIKTPTPTPSPKPSPSVTPSASPTETPDTTPTPRPSPRVSPTPHVSPSPTPRSGPRPTPNPNNDPN